MKIFQIAFGFCHWDATPQFPTLASTVGRFPPTDLFVEAPDYVFEGWGFDETKEGDERFIKPVNYQGFEYDENTGTWYDPNYVPEPTAEEQLRADVDFLLAMNGFIEEGGESDADSI